MSPSNTLSLTAEVPWFTFGRRETNEELGQKWREQTARLAYLPLSPKFHFFVEVAEGARLASVRRVAEEFVAQSYPEWKVTFLTAGDAAPLLEQLDDIVDDRLDYTYMGNILEAVLDATERLLK